MQPSGATMYPVLRSDYDDQNCSIARTLELVGERWSLLILREAFLGTRRFDDFQRRLGIARNVLQSRLQRLTDGEIMRRVAYQERPVRYEYRLTRKGVDLWPAIVALMKWGDQYAAPDGPPTLLEHRGCSGEIDDRRRCTRCGAELEAWDVVPVRGPGAKDLRLPEPTPAGA
jgi:DNA-binding HxlR family transcriptional regulator